MANFPPADWSIDGHEPRDGHERPASGVEQSDLELVRRVQRGERGAFDLLVFTSSAELPPALRQACLDLRAQGVPLRVTAVGAAAAVAGADRVIADPEGRCRSLYGAQAEGAAYLLRPDQHVCARWQALDATRLRAALRTALPA